MVQIEQQMEDGASGSPRPGTGNTTYFETHQTFVKQWLSTTPGALRHMCRVPRTSVSTTRGQLEVRR